ncbi:DUF3857 domain-containing protein [Qipengyuania flava]|uniref:DUF3857 domain-containing protein n=1 Tax=Qipengyuania flava TaxID=192812 RepID=UPI001C62CAF6|nr:DUF3857 domain-containing protein [Qipengyuania flava]QYJ06329.1 DUF3857 domain-containing protein [Qipengyuania flava]
MHRFALAAAPLVVLSAPAIAGDEVRFVDSPGWVEAVDAEAAFQTRDDVPLYDRQVRLEDGVVSRYTDIGYRISTTEALQELGTLQFVWMPDKGDLAIHRLHILRDGAVIDLIADGLRPEILRRERELEQRSVDGALTAVFAIPGLKVGDILRVTSSTSQRDQALSGEMQATEAVLAKPTQVGLGRLLMSWPTERPMEWRTLGDVAQPEVEERGGFTVLSFDLPVEQPAKMPDDAPGRYRVSPQLQVGSFADWPEVSRTMGAHFGTEGAIAAGDPVHQQVERIRAATNDPLERAALALRLVQDEVSYLLNGMDGGNYLPQSPAETWSKRYGDCKAKSLLLLAMLREMDIVAEAVLVDTTNGDSVAISQPLPGAFDHMVVRAVIGDTEYWLDGTSSGTRLDTISEVPDFAWALPLREAGSELIPVTQRWPTAPDRSIRVTYDMSAGVDLPVLYEADVELRGIMGSRLRAQAAQQDRATLIGVATKYLEEVLGGFVYDAQITYDDDAGVARLIAEGMTFEQFGFERGMASHQVPGATTNWSFKPDRARSIWRDIPYRTGGPLTMQERWIYTLPEGADSVQLTGLAELDEVAAAVRFSRKTKLTADRFEISDSTSYIPTEIPVSELGEGRRAIRRIASGDPVLRLENPQRYWDLDDRVIRRKLQPHIDAATSLIAMRDDVASFYSLRAGFYTLRRDFEEAIADFDRAIDLEATPQMYRLRSEAYNALGRYEEALADAQTAFDLQGDIAYASHLAKQLSKAGRADEALELIDQLGLSGDEGLDAEIVWSELSGHAGREPEAWDRLQVALDERPDEAALLNSQCWTAGIWNYQVELAEEVCDRAVAVSGNSAGVLDSRALAFYRLGRKDDAMKDLEAALAQEPGQAASLFLRGLIRLEDGDRGGREDLVKARRISPDIDHLYKSYGLVPD